MTKPKPIVYKPFQERFEKWPEEDFKACSSCNHLYDPSRKSEHLRSPEHLAARQEEFAWACADCNHLYDSSQKSEHLHSPEHLAALAAEVKNL